ncbi:TetR/AcrR family transcriptional regulator [Paracoccus denitrificans]|jgi:AcrR family transcriptional regulator|nr:TetR/AcrR family transcriptional regulator [Paracoccus denitrificans]MBB4629275.1 AcrR family transcriptional regulator [Paracoccus denitrificans]MCU7430294.1 TetR family transcriptional regulator [Paracoccus denitrificans]QAR29675.1 TetR/AcrR family transcriptional regulator [Paracoccus denitrificans]UPV98551.1 TetR family transcriptional regulator [Paracoccus denitrificans]WQO36665.1 TetR/AcrR family transcriptional regulator [Paracoccus denitrificans]
MTEKPTPDRILDAAERLFAEHGGEDGVSMRELAAAADVKLSLLSYHFGGKAGLYRAVFARRASQLADARSDALDKAMEHPDFGISDLAEAFVRPSVAMRYSGNRQGAAFALLTAFEASDPREAERGILAQHYDPTALRFIAALSRLYPDAPRQSVADAYLFMVGALVMTLVSGSRFARLGAHESGEEQSTDTENMTRHLIDFCTGGADAILSSDDPAKG